MQLRAGDGVAYVSPTILHWGSSYTPTMRRESHDLLASGLHSSKECQQ